MSADSASPNKVRVPSERALRNNRWIGATGFIVGLSIFGVQGGKAMEAHGRSEALTAAADLAEQNGNHELATNLDLKSTRSRDERDTRGMSAALAIIPLVSGPWSYLSARDQLQRLKSNSGTSPVTSGQLYDGPDTTRHAEPPAEIVEARVEVPLTPPIEWQPPQPQADPHAGYRRPQ